MITMKELSQIVGAFEDDKVYDLGVDDVFSWRGSYNKPCFSFAENVTGKHMKEVMRRAFEEVFCGYKGGEYEYEDWMTCNFERDPSGYTDGSYFSSICIDYSGTELIQEIRKLL